LKTIYPSKQFFADSAAAIRAHEILEIQVVRGWRAKILEKEVVHWLPVNNIDLLAKGWKGPSWKINILMVYLHGIYYTALAENYQMQASVGNGSILLTFFPREALIN
jgi:hypothetical protein